MGQILQSHTGIISELSRQLQEKVDRVEFSQIVDSKANSSDLQRLLHSLLSAKSLSDLHRSERMANMLQESAGRDDLSYSRSRSAFAESESRTQSHVVS